MVESRELGPVPGDRTLLDLKGNETRILITIDTDFGELIYLENLSHAGLVRLPDVPITYDFSKLPSHARSRGPIGSDWCAFILMALVTAINLDAAEYETKILTQFSDLRR